MPISYATFSEFTAIYSVQGVSQAEISSVWLFKGAEELNRRLGTYFTLPFSSNNTTARFLSIDMAYLGILRRTLKAKDSEELQTWVNAQVKEIADRNTPMITDSGDLVTPSAGGATGFWSTDQEFKPTFDTREASKQRISLDRQEDLDDRDN